jgi:hypothetical protein
MRRGRELILKPGGGFNSRAVPPRRLAAIAPTVVFRTAGGKSPVRRKGRRRRSTHAACSACGAGTSPVRRCRCAALDGARTLPYRFAAKAGIACAFPGWARTRRAVPLGSDARMSARPSLMSVARALKIDRAIRRNVYAYHLFRDYVDRLGFMLPLELEFHAFGFRRARPHLRQLPDPAASNRLVDHMPPASEICVVGTALRADTKSYISGGLFGEYLVTSSPSSLRQPELYRPNPNRRTSCKMNRSSRLGFA